LFFQLESNNIIIITTIILRIIIVIGVITIIIICYLSCRSLLSHICQMVPF